MYPPETATAQLEPISHTQPVRHAHPSSWAAEQWVSFQLHREALERFIPRGVRVLEVSPGEGHFTEVLHRLGCKISLLGAPDELGAVLARAGARGFEPSIEVSREGSICSLESFGDGAFEAVVAYGGVLGFALERRDRALAECMRVLGPGGLLLVGVPSLWGTLHRHLPEFLARDLVDNRAVIRSGHLSRALARSASAGGSRPCHLFRAAELEAFLRRGGLEVLSLSASSALSTGVDAPLASDPSVGSALLEYERSACVERGYLDSGAQIIAVARR